jgi:hypothetical protein
MVGILVRRRELRSNEGSAPRFLEEGIWEVDNPTNKKSTLVNAMRVRDRIAIKAA